MASKDNIAFGVSLFSAFCLVVYFPGSIVNERPIHSIVFALSLCSAILLALRNAAPLFFRRAKDDSEYKSIPLDEPAAKAASQAVTAYPGVQSDGITVRAKRLLFMGSLCALPLRIEVYRQIAKATECTVRSPEVFLPLLVAVYDAIRGQPSGLAKNNLPVSKYTVIQRYLLHHKWRYLPSALILSTGLYLSLQLWNKLNSTYICPLVVSEPFEARSLPLIQILALLLDAYLVVSAFELLKANGSASPTPRTPLMLSTILLSAPVVWIVVGTIVYFTQPHYRRRLMSHDLIYSFSFMFTLSGHTALICAFFISTMYIIPSFGPVFVTATLTTLCVMIPGTSFLWSLQSSYALPPFSTRCLSFLLIYIGWTSLYYVRQTQGGATRSSLLHQAAILILFLFLIYPGFKGASDLEAHPIDDLIRNATNTHQSYRADAAKSRSLQDAVVEYKRRYSMRPPPGFDLWYEYAQNRSTLIIDEYDQIYEDLLPFRMTLPADLRWQTWAMTSNPWNEISGISIRDGEATVLANVIPTHRWMLEGIAILLNSFARHLPDMILAFNINDESRVAVPFGDLSALRAQARGVKLSGHEDWSSNRSEGWLPIPEEPFRESKFRDSSFRNTWSRFGSIGCDPNSPARKHQHLSDWSKICHACAAPHSIGQFLSNWSLAADVCHQPDLSHLHGFYLSPAAFKTSYDLRPVFSQSKPRGFNDILYPSAWNYMDKAKYDPSEPSGDFGTDTYQPGFPDPDFKLKKNTLFWRGATSEGVSSGDHAWRGMTRQRLVHMANNLTRSQHDYTTVLLPRPGSGDETKYAYITIPGPTLTALGFSTDIQVVDRIVRCGGIGLHDCHDQEQEFALVPPSDFQSHWKYRYLFDLDGAGFSGRFLPFLQSKSLPFKTALFREWYDSRLTAWKHFVPQDLRLQGVWSTLAYFAGVDGTVNGKHYEMTARTEAGEEIATAGREWANKVLRKEDMEVYFFRLLLEWGRLTDDNRNNLGFAI